MSSFLSNLKVGDTIDVIETLTEIKEDNITAIRFNGTTHSIRKSIIEKPSKCKLLLLHSQSIDI